MIKINLLPSQVLEQGKVKAWLYASVAAVVVVAVALLLVTQHLNRQLLDEQTRVAYWTKEAAKVGQVTTTVTLVQGQTGPFAAWNAFFAAIPAHNSRYATQLEEISRYVYNQVQLKTLTWGGASVSMDGMADNLDSVIKAYMNLQQAPPFIRDSVTFQTDVPAWSPGVTLRRTPGGLPSAGGQVRIALAATLQPDRVFTPPVPPGIGGIAAPGGPAAPADGGVGGLRGRFGGTRN